MAWLNPDTLAVIPESSLTSPCDFFGLCWHRLRQGVPSGCQIWPPAANSLPPAMRTTAERMALSQQFHHSALTHSHGPKFIFSHPGLVIAYPSSQGLEWTHSNQLRVKGKRFRDDKSRAFYQKKEEGHIMGHYSWYLLSYEMPKVLRNS